MSEKPLTRRDVSADATKGAILAVARERFGRLGFAASALADIAADSRATTGAIYHHFGDKKRLFLDVAQAVERTILEQVALACAGLADPWRMVDVGLTKTLEICCQPDIRRIIVLDAPNVAGAAEWRRIEMQFGYGMMHAALTELQRQGSLAAPSAEIAAPILLGSLLEAINFVCEADDQEVAKQQAIETLRLLASSLRRQSAAVG